MRIALLSGVAVAAAAGLLRAAPVGVVSHIKVVSDKVEDVSSPEDWQKTYIKPGMSDHEKALAIWKTVVKYRHQTTPPDEHVCSDGNVHDVFKTIHVYGYGQCCCASANCESLARLLGYEARGRIIRQHSVPEMFYGGDWHLIDGSLMNYFVKPDGGLASVDDLRKAVRGWYEQNPELARELRGVDSKLRAFARNEGWKKGPALLAGSAFYDKDGINAAGWHGWPSTMQEYDWSDEKATVFDYGGMLGYRLNLQLRPGERIARNWFDLGDHINKPEGDPGILGNQRSVLALQTKLGDLAPGRVGNGTHDYDVPLSSRDLPAACLRYDGLQVGKMPILTTADGNRPGVLEIRMPSSYVYLGGAVELLPMVGAQGKVVVAISRNHGLDWEDVATYDPPAPEAAGQPPAPQTIDLTGRIRHQYDYRLRFTLTGAGTGLETLRIRQRIQHSQAPLPALAAGENKIAFSAAPAEGTVTYEGNLDPEAARQHGQLAFTDYHPALDGLSPKLLRVGDTGSGTATLRLAAPGDLTAVRLCLHYRARDKNGRDGFAAELSFDNGGSWKPMGKFDKGQPATMRYLTFTDIPAGTRAALLRLNGYQNNTACIFNLRLDADYAEPYGGFRPVKITYLWQENGAAKQDVHVAKSPEEAYTIACAAAPLMKSIVLELADADRP